ncbi:hypothetical protein [Spiroplasma endosymbiont of Nebria brevicollis]|uniref:hypothetical protein n=1 Tax=Spiroplasma endosymbiont of Nebria brevicollis TaxID=3066284 RepID=UPI00313F0D10
MLTRSQEKLTNEEILILNGFNEVLKSHSLTFKEVKLKDTITNENLEIPEVSKIEESNNKYGFKAWEIEIFDKIIEYEEEVENIKEEHNYSKPLSLKIN